MDNTVDTKITLQDTEIYRRGHPQIIPSIFTAKLYFGTCQAVLTRRKFTFGFMMLGKCLKTNISS